MKDRMAKVCDRCYSELKKRGGEKQLEYIRMIDWILWVHSVYLSAHIFSIAIIMTHLQWTEIIRQSWQISQQLNLLEMK